MSDLLCLSQEDRDTMLSTLVFRPFPTLETLGHSLATRRGREKVINYSQVMAEIDPNETCCPDPVTLRNGDCVQFGDNRGIGRRYVLWLRKGIFVYEGEDLEKLRESIVRIGGGAKKQRKESSASGVTPDTDALDCYMFEHHDEHGRMAPPIASSQPQDYYKKLFLSTEMFFDPLLTVSTSFYGAMYVEAKKSEQWKNNEDFPFQYIGRWDGEVVRWKRIDEMTSSDVPRGYFTFMRTVFNRHFFS